MTCGRVQHVKKFCLCYSPQSVPFQLNVCQFRPHRTTYCSLDRSIAVRDVDYAFAWYYVFSETIRNRKMRRNNGCPCRHDDDVQHSPFGDNDVSEELRLQRYGDRSSHGILQCTEYMFPSSLHPHGRSTSRQICPECHVDGVTGGGCAEVYAAELLLDLRMDWLLSGDKVGVDLRTAVVRNLHALQPCARGASFQQPPNQQYQALMGQHKRVLSLIETNEELVSVRQGLVEDIEEAEAWRHRRYLSVVVLMPCYYHRTPLQLHCLCLAPVLLLLMQPLDVAPCRPQSVCQVSPQAGTALIVLHLDSTQMPLHSFRSLLLAEVYKASCILVVPALETGLANELDRRSLAYMVRSLIGRALQLYQYPRRDVRSLQWALSCHL